MKETTEYDKIMLWRYARHCVVIINALLSLAFFHYAGYLLYTAYKFVF